MGKFAIMCPKCNQYVTAYNGLRGMVQNKVTCTCGNVINVKAERMTSAICPGCGNSVVYDQGKSIPVCPVCKKKIEPSAENRVISFKCPECGVGLSVTEGTEHYICPVCDNHIDVQREIAKQQYAKQGLISEIKYEGDNNTLIWKHPLEDFSTGTQLIVHESQEAVFFRDGQALDLFGPDRYTLETQNLPLMNKIYHLPTGDARTTFHCEVYFINTATIMGVKWGTDTKIRIFDPMSGMHVSIGASGEFNIKVTDSRRLLLKSVGTTNGLIIEAKQRLGSPEEFEKARQKSSYDSKPGEFKKYFRSLIVTRVKNYLANVIKEESISVLELDAQTEKMSEALGEKINVGLEDYGLTMSEFYITRFLTPEDDPDDPMYSEYMRMKSLYSQQFLNVKEEQVKKATAEAARERMAVEAQTEAQMKIIGAQGDAAALKIQKEAEAEAYRMKAEAEAAEMRMKGYTYQQETARQVGVGAMKNGLTGGGSGGLGDIASLGVGLGAMSGVIGMTKEAMQPMTESASQMGQSIHNGITGAWDCPKCGQKGLSGRFCHICGTEKPQPIPENSETWDCICGQKGLTGKFCPECGAKRPEPVKKETWDCACGQKGLTGKFCPECGAKRPEKKLTWDCSCGEKNISGKFCPECGKKREE
mgnify:FL=1